MVLLLRKCSGPGKRSRKSSFVRLGSISLLILAAEEQILPHIKYLLMNLLIRRPLRKYVI